MAELPQDTARPGSKDNSLPSPESQASSSIKELQEAFGPLLLSRKENLKRPPATYYPKWTGTFRLYDFPRELRDAIYFHLLFRPRGITYRPGSTLAWPFEDNAFQCVFVTSRQVYEEALEVFFRYNTLHLSRSTLTPGKMRLFPDKTAGIVQKVQVDCSLVWEWYKPSSYNFNKLWQTSLKQALLAERFFPRLRDYKVVWQSHSVHLNSGVTLDPMDKMSDKPEEAQLSMWLQWLRDAFERDRLTPPKWLRVHLQGDHAHAQASFNQALDSFRAELASRPGREEELEQSGRRWIEEYWPESKRRTRKKRRA
ncbi:hypothetical protein BS50DRAFT_268754 [Corynespora cassiicola Philippines]|uniref:Uncharacterized protein n=1 Tax=Corynespora cassiicola Philippines TaxID=1448308 RepID=A0A2T2NZL4_CORCC|nr:hypothetical protein BS50DRAFT_268754 [Corynespora cassiicola Philippines]